MSEVTIYGASDDLVEVEGDAAGCDEYPSEDAHFVLTGDAGQVRVRCWYTDRGIWAIAAAPVSEGAPMLSVAISGYESGYSAQAVVTGVISVIHEAVREAPDER
jgi:hypothetical protein